MIAGRYSLDHEIGRGGMGPVWLGRDEVLGREVALKRIGLLPGVDSTDLARAEREARLAARLNHPHVVAVFNLVTDVDSGSRWLVMEYVDGATLAQLVYSEERLSPDDAAPLMWQAADALVAAHAAGIVHRDVKPSNILVDRRGRVKLTDFGIARIAGDPALTQTGLVTGSPAYLAPEVASGNGGDAAVDVWSFGATLFHVLSGRPPYEMGDHVLGGLYRIVNDDPPRLADAGWMTPLLEATLVKDPALRWSMREVRDFLAGQDAPAVPAETAAAGPPRTPETPSTRMLGAVGPAAGSRMLARPVTRWLLAGLALSLLLAFVLVPVLKNGPPAEGLANGPSASPTATDSSPTATASSPDPSPSKDPAAARPTARGMKSFIRGYVAAVASDPDTAWTMLTPKFQRQSGGLDAYRSFWSGVGSGRILQNSADPRSLVVSYRVRFDSFGTGRRPTVLDLRFTDGRYLIDGERTEGSSSTR